LFITSELVPYHYRALVQSLVYAITTVVNFGVSFATLPLYRYVGVWAFVPLFIVPPALALTYLWAVMPETRGREIHEIVAQLMSQAGGGSVAPISVVDKGQKCAGEAVTERRRSRADTARELCSVGDDGMGGREVRALTATSIDVELGVGRL